MAGIIEELCRGEQTSAAMYAQVEIQAQLAKANYDNAHDARRIAAMEKGYAPRSRLDALAEQDLADAGLDGDRLQRFRLLVWGQQFFWFYKLDQPNAMADLKVLLEASFLPPPSKVLSSDDQKEMAEYEAKMKQKQEASKVDKPRAPYRTPEDPEEPFLKMTSVDYTNIDDICLAFKTNTTFVKVDMSNNVVDVDGARAIGDMLLTNNTLQSLDLSGNELTNDGIQPLADALKQNTSLTCLELAAVSIGLQGARYLAAALRENQSLTKLVVAGNDKLGLRGLEEISSALHHNHSLVSLGLSGTNCGDPGAELLSNLLDSNPTLTDLGLDGNRIENDNIRKLQERLDQNWEKWWLVQMELAVQRKAEREQVQRELAARRAQEEGVRRLAREEEERALAATIQQASESGPLSASLSSLPKAPTPKAQASPPIAPTKPVAKPASKPKAPPPAKAKAKPKPAGKR